MPREISTEERKELARAVVAKMPKGFTDEEFDRVFKPAMEQALGIAENTNAPLQGSSLSRALRGVWNSLPSPKALYQALPLPQAIGGGGMIEGPVNAVTGLAGAHIDQARKAMTAETGWERAGHGAAALLPVIGPVAADIGEKWAASASPSSPYGDVAGAVAGGTALAAPFTYGAASKVRAQSKARSGAADVLERKAVEQVADRVLAPGNVAYKGRARDIAPEVLRRGRGGRDELRELADAGMAESGATIDNAITAAGGSSKPVQIAPAVAQLQKSIDDLMFNGQPIAGTEARVAELQRRVSQLQGAGNRNWGNVTFDELRKFRDEQYRLADEARAYERKGNPIKSDEGAAARDAGSAIRQTFAQDVPGLAAANADYAFFKTLGDVLDPAVGRPKATAPPAGVTGGSRTSGAVAGAIVGPKAAFVLSVVKPWIDEVRSTPAWQLADAQDKMRLAAAIRAGNVPRAKNLMTKITQASPRQATSPTESRTQTTGPAWSTP